MDSVNNLHNYADGVQLLPLPCSTEAGVLGIHLMTLFVLNASCKVETVTPAAIESKMPLIGCCMDWATASTCCGFTAKTCGYTRHAVRQAGKGTVHRAGILQHTHTHRGTEVACGRQRVACCMECVYEVWDRE